jgi:hypothetical protein
VNRRLIPAGVLVSLATALLIASPAGAVTFTNPSALAAPDLGQDAKSIPVSGQAGTVAKARVTLNDFSTMAPGDIDVLLVAPGGQRGLVMSDACNSGSFLNAQLTFDDAAGSTIPAMCGMNSAGGTFLPTDVAPVDVFDPPAPGPPYPATLSTFVGAAPNGTWTLYLFDDAAGMNTLAFGGGGWTLNLDITPPPPVPAAAAATATTAKKCKKGKKLKRGKCVKKKKKK